MKRNFEIIGFSKIDYSHNSEDKNLFKLNQSSVKLREFEVKTWRRVFGTFKIVKIPMELWINLTNQN